MEAPSQRIERLAYTPREVAQLLGVSYATVMRLISAGKLQKRGDLRTILIPRSSVEDFLR